MADPELLSVCVEIPHPHRPEALCQQPIHQVPAQRIRLEEAKYSTLMIFSPGMAVAYGIRTSEISFEIIRGHLWACTVWWQPLQALCMDLFFALQCTIT